VRSDNALRLLMALALKELAALTSRRTTSTPIWAEATAGDHNHLLAVTMRTVDVA
jgi:hypothetical protein